MFSMFVQVMKIKSFKLSDGLSIFDSKYEKNGIYVPEDYSHSTCLKSIA